jgi:hypothetical protein
MGEPKTNKIIVGKAYTKADEINYKEITERLVKLERTLSGYADSYNIPGLPPVKGIIAWHKSLGPTTTLPGSWVECNGQTLDDISSDLHGQVIPNLNGAASGADLSNGDNLGKTGDVFLRGDETSGVTQLDSFQGHWHYLAYQNNKGLSLNAGGSNYNLGFGTTGSGSDKTDEELVATNSITDGTNGTPRTGTVTKPRNMSVVWIMRVK